MIYQIKNNMSRLGGFVLTSLIFGGFAACWLGLHRDLRDAKAMLAWVEVPARVLECELKSEQNKDGDVTNFHVAAKYSYVVDGQNHTGQRVEAGRFSKGGEAVQRQRYQALKTARDSGEPIVCRVNPARPSDSVVFGEFIFDNGFVALQVALLAAMAGGLWFACRMISELRFRRGARIPMERTSSHIIAAVMTAVLGLCALEMLRLAIQILGFSHCPWRLYIPLIPAGIALMIATRLWRQRRGGGGASVLELSPCPAIAGRMMHASIRVPLKIESEAQARLRCVKHNGREKTMIKQRVLWQDCKAVPIRAIGENESQADVGFMLSADHASTAGLGDSGGLWWELTLMTNGTPNMPCGYTATFEIPVARG